MTFTPSRSGVSPAPTSEPDAEQLPFAPFDKPLREILRRRYIRNVAAWLMGQSDNSVLAQAGNSVWEAALTVAFLSEANAIFEDVDEEIELRGRIRYKIPVVARWLLSKKIDEGSDETSWEHVTWDTCVTIRALIIALKETPAGFSETERHDIIEVVRRGVRWLCRRFSEWEARVKYPFGPADVAQIVIVLLHLARDYPELYLEARTQYSMAGGSDDVIVEIVQYLLHKKTEKTLTIATSVGAEDVISYWWDDHFSTAEVVEALALFHQYCESMDSESSQRQVLHTVKEALVRACSFFEHDQVDGMWGSHVDTIKVIYAYVIIRRVIPQRMAGVDEPLITPEIHTTFKAVRWMCDEKQVFSDGSFLHTMFLTIFYAMALVEVYRSWDPCGDPIAKIYDDVVWFSPVRTTPERSKRLAAELENNDLKDRLDRERTIVRKLSKRLESEHNVRQRIVWTAITTIASMLLLVGVGATLGVAKVRYDVTDVQDYLTYLGVFLTVFLALITVIWKYDNGTDEKP
jgi:hypothetical protein